MKLVLALSLTMLLPSAIYAQATNSSSQSEAKPSKQAGPDVSASRATVTANLEVFTDTQGVDFGPYLTKVLQSVRKNWYSLIPEEARPPEMKAGKVAIEFVILRDGKIAGVTLRTPSGDVPLDRAAWGAITASAPFAPLPEEFHGRYLGLRFHFFYNPNKIPELPAKPNQK